MILKEKEITMKRAVDLRSTVYDICNIYPEIVTILYELGFKDILKPGMLSTVGRFMTISKGAEMKKMDMEVIKERFLEKGYLLME